MSTRMSSMWPGLPADSGLDLLGHEMLAEKAAALGRAGRKAEATVARLHAGGGDEANRAVLLKAAAEAVHAFFIQRELCGLRRHDSVIRELDIPRALLVRLGAR